MSSPGSELRRVRSLIADLDGIVWEADARTMLFTFVSSGSTPILGYTPQEWLARPTFWADRIHPDDRERTIAQFVRAATAGWSFDTEYRVLARDGSVVWLRDLGHVVRDVGGPADAPSRPDGRRHEAEAGRGGAAQRRGAVPHGRGTPARHRLPGGDRGRRPGASRPLLYVSPQVESILGFTTQEWLANPAARSDRFVTDDLERVQKERRRVEEPGEPFSAEYRMLARDGRTVWFRDEAVLVRDEEDRPVFWQGIMYDVTRQRESEALARETETRYRALVEQLPAIVYSESVVEGAHDLTYINSRVEEILGSDPGAVARGSGRQLARPHPPGRSRRRRAGEHPLGPHRRAVRGRVPDGHRGRPDGLDPRRGGAGPRRARQPEVLAGGHDGHHGTPRGGEQPGRGRGALPRPGRADTDDHLPGFAGRAAVHAVHEPADRRRSSATRRRTGTTTTICSTSSCIRRTSSARNTRPNRRASTTPRTG